MHKTTLLIIDDDKDILTVLKANLMLQGFEVRLAENWQEGKSLFEKGGNDLIILDLSLPDVDGIQICKIIRQDYKSQIPIIMLTARDKLSDKVIGLESGADDYIVKPFETLELIARIKACLRRADTKRASEVIKVGDITLDVKRRRVTNQLREIVLTPKEFNILQILMSRQGEVVSRDEIKRHLWKEEKLYSWSRVIDVHIQHIRSKLDPENPERYIKTVPAVGYKFIEQGD